MINILDSSHEFEKWRAIRASVGGVLALVPWMACLGVWRGFKGWRTGVDGMLLLFLFLLLKYYPEEKNSECLLLR